jgi:peroxiredoxin
MNHNFKAGQCRQRNEIRRVTVKNRKSVIASLAVLAALALAAPMAQAVRVGEKAPEFTATDTNGQPHKLSEYAGKYVVLEWTNRDCPYTRKHYSTGNMQQLQREWTKKGVIWLTVQSSAPGEQGYITAPEENAYVKQANASPTAVFLDPTGAIGHLYGAKTTPDMYVINPQGILIYEGAIDNRPSADPEDVKTAENYVSLALTQAMAGRSLSVATSRPYGCSVKYKN